MSATTRLQRVLGAARHGIGLGMYLAGAHVMAAGARLVGAPISARTIGDVVITRAQLDELARMAERITARMDNTP